MSHKFNQMSAETLDQMARNIANAYGAFDEGYDTLMTVTKDEDIPATAEQLRDLQGDIAKLMHALLVFDQEVFG